MDEKTNEIIASFIQYLTQEFQSRKDYKKIQINKWSLKDFRLTVEIFIDNEREHLYFDIRELKENADRFSHLLTSAFSQLATKLYH